MERELRREVRDQGDEVRGGGWVADGGEEPIMDGTLVGVAVVGQTSW
jgi:hypothetical protein